MKPHVYEYAVMVRKTSRAEFAAAKAHPFLVSERMADSEGDGWTFKTSSVSTAVARVGQAVAAERIRLTAEVANCEVFPVVKGFDNPWPERVSVGRARNNDIVLADSSVSKLHAHFRCADGGEYLLADAGSRNGTLVNARPLAAGEVVQLKSGDSVGFGRVNVTFLDAGGFYDLISKNVVSSHE